MCLGYIEPSALFDLLCVDWTKVQLYKMGRAYGSLTEFTSSIKTEFNTLALNTIFWGYLQGFYLNLVGIRTNYENLQGLEKDLAGW